MAFFLDNFVEPTINTVLNSHTPDIGTGWTLLHQDTVVTLGAQASTDTGKCLTGANDSGAIYTADATYPSANYEVELTITALSSVANRPLYILVRIQDVDNMYAVRMKNNASGYQMYKKVAGVWSTLGSAVTVANGSIVKLQINGTTLKLFDDGVEVASATDSSISAAGKAGLAVGGGAELVTSTDDANTLTEFDVFSVTDLGGATTEQEGFRFRNDDGSESSATWKANQDVNIYLSRISPFRLRTLLNTTGDLGSSAFRMEYRRKEQILLQDAFDDNSFNTSIWSKNYFYTPNEDQSVTVLETGGFLEVTPLSSVTSVHFNGALSVQQYDLTNHNMVIKGDQVVNAAEGASCTFLYVSPNPSVETYMGFAYEDSAIYFRYVVAGTPSSVVITYNSTDHAWMRLRHDPSDDTIKWETSSNGSTWTLRRSASRPFAITNLYVQSLGAGTYLSVASPGSAKATNFSLSLNATDWAAVA